MVPKLDVLENQVKEAHVPRVELSIVLPAYNEAGSLEHAVQETVQALTEVTDSYEILIAEDGSTDGTGKIALSLTKRYCNVRHIHSDTRLGRGKALKNAFAKSQGRILIYMDVDLATKPTQLKALVSAIKQGYDFATGSRILQQSLAIRTPGRQIASRCYNFMVRTMLGSKIRDHQCGFKAAKRAPLLQIQEEVTADHWFWDTETLVRAARRGYKIAELPVEWTEKERTRVKLIRDSLEMGSQVIRLWWSLKIESDKPHSQLQDTIRPNNQER